MFEPPARHSSPSPDDAKPAGVLAADIIRTCLLGLNHPAGIVVQDIEPVRPEPGKPVRERTYCVTLCFDEADSNIVRSRHVHAWQLQEGIPQALRCALGYALYERKLGIENDIKWLRSTYAEWFAREQSVTFSQEVKVGDPFQLMVEVGDLTEMRRLGTGESTFSIKFAFRGAVRGEETCILRSRSVILRDRAG